MEVRSRQDAHAFISSAARNAERIEPDECNT
jgi:hypothetical protein